MLAPLHQPTLLLVEVGIALLTTALLSMAAVLAGDRAEQRAWALGNLLATVGLLVGAMTMAPDFVHAVLSYGLMGLGLALVLRGLRLHCGLGLGLCPVLVITGLALALPAVFLWVVPSLAGRLLVTGAFFGLLNWACAAVLLRGMRKGTRAVMWVTTAGFLLFGVVLLLRAGVLALHPTEANEDLQLVMALTLFCIPLAQVAITFGLMMMIARRYVEELRRLSVMDKLTGVHNRAGMEMLGSRVLQRARMARRPVCALMIDADHFKRINDEHGHAGGDAVLRQIAEAIGAPLRPGDLLARFGGEEFVALLEGLDQDGGLRVAERLRERVEASAVQHGTKLLRCTISVGVACSRQQGDELAPLLAAADKALYEAKQQGRNRVVGAVELTP